MKAIQFIQSTPQHDACLKPIHDWLAKRGYSVTWRSGADVQNGIVVASHLNVFKQAPVEVLKHLVWIDHGLAGHLKRNVPGDFQQYVKLNLWESEYALRMALVNKDSYCSMSYSSLGGCVLRRGSGTTWDGSNSKVVGFPKNDRLFSCLEQDREIQAEVAKMEALLVPSKPFRPTILYAPTAGDSGGAIAGNRDSVGPRVIDTLKDLGDLRVKVHPVGAPLKVPAGVDVIAPGADITPYLTTADILVTDCSSVMLEYAILDRPIIQVIDNLPSHLITDIGIAAHTWDLREAVQRALEKPNEHQANRTAWVKRTNYLLDSHATERAAQAILEVAE